MTSLEFVLNLAFGNEDNLFFFLAHTQVTPTIIIMVQAKRTKQSALANPIIAEVVIADVVLMSASEAAINK